MRSQLLAASLPWYVTSQFCLLHFEHHGFRHYRHQYDDKGCDTAVYKEMPWHLKEQMADAMAHAKAHPGACPSDIPVQ